MSCRPPVPRSSRVPLTARAVSAVPPAPGRRRGLGPAAGLLLAILTATSGLARPAAAQASVAELRKEVERLRSENEALQQALTDAMARIAALEAELAAGAGRTGDQRGGDVPPPPPPVSIDETPRFASPRSLLRDTIAAFTERAGDLAPGDDPRGAERRTWMEMVERFRLDWEREQEARVTWHVRLEGGRAVSRADSRVRLNVVAIDPVTGTVLGEPFVLQMTGRIDADLRQLRRRGDLGGERPVIEVEGIARPELRINPQRRERGVFDRPPFVGPFLEFGMVLDATVVRPPGTTAAAEERRQEAERSREDERERGGDGDGSSSSSRSSSSSSQPHGGR